MKRFFGAIGAFLKSPFKIMTPDDSFTMAWTVIMIVVTFVDIILGPYWVSFYKDQNHTEPSFIESTTFLEVMFALDVIITFRTSFYDKGILVIKQKYISQHYLKNGFSIDVIVIITTLIAAVNF